LRLVHFLIVKSIIELVLVSVLGVGFFLTTFNPALRGSVDQADDQRVSGWALNEASQDERVEVQLFIDGHFVAAQVARLPRPDLVAAGRAKDALHGYAFDVPHLSYGEHEARIYGLGGGAGPRRALLIVGKPSRFKVTTAADQPSPSIGQPVERKD
jgi:hypothetical protein